MYHRPNSISPHLLHGRLTPHVANKSSQPRKPQMHNDQPIPAGCICRVTRLYMIYGWWGSVLLTIHNRNPTQLAQDVKSALCGPQWLCRGQYHTVFLQSTGHVGALEAMTLDNALVPTWTKTQHIFTFLQVLMHTVLL